jgi:hypothetical protein
MKAIDIFIIILVPKNNVVGGQMIYPDQIDVVERLLGEPMAGTIERRRVVREPDFEDVAIPVEMNGFDAAGIGGLNVGHGDWELFRGRHQSSPFRFRERLLAAASPKT